MAGDIGGEFDGVLAAVDLDVGIGDGAFGAGFEEGALDEGDGVDEFCGVEVHGGGRGGGGARGRGLGEGFLVDGPKGDGEKEEGEEGGGEGNGFVGAARGDGDNEALDAGEEVAAGGGEGEVILGRVWGAEFFDGEEGFGVEEGIADEGGREVVAAVFALLADVGGDPPDGGVVEEEGFDEGLQEIDEIIVAANVGEFVGEDGLELRGGKTGEEGCGEKDERAEEADDEGRCDERGLGECEGTRDVHFFG